MDLVEVMGKKNRKVPVLITPMVKEALEHLISHRQAVGIKEDNPYIFATV